MSAAVSSASSIVSRLIIAIAARHAMNLVRPTETQAKRLPRSGRCQPGLRERDGLPCLTPAGEPVFPSCTDFPMRNFATVLVLALCLASPALAENTSEATPTKQRQLECAEQADAEAQTNLGWMYEKGRGVPQDFAQAVACYRKAAEQGYARAQTNLGWMYENGRGVPQDYEQAVVYYRKAAEQGNARAQNNLGWSYKNGHGVAQDDTQAVGWFRKAAEQEDTLAQNNLGIMYRDGRGVEQDDAQAVVWFRKAAAHRASPK